MAAQNGSLTLVTAQRVMTVDVYLPDAAGTNWTFSPNSPAGSGSQAQYVIPSDGFITDLSVAASPTATNVNIQVNSASIAGNQLRYANFLAANPNRPKLRIPVRKGDILTALQSA